MYSSWLGWGLVGLGSAGLFWFAWDGWNDIIHTNSRHQLVFTFEAHDINRMLRNPFSIAHHFVGGTYYLDTNINSMFPPLAPHVIFFGQNTRISAAFFCRNARVKTQRGIFQAPLKSGSPTISVPKHSDRLDSVLIYKRVFCFGWDWIRTTLPDNIVQVRIMMQSSDDHFIIGLSEYSIVARQPSQES